MSYARNSEALERKKERQEREDSAPRLATEIPKLRTMKMSVTFTRGELSTQPGHVRHVIVPRAPALFIVPCADRECKNGGYDLTDQVMQNLRSGREAFSGTCRCEGELGSAAARCGGELRFDAEATFG